MTVQDAICLANQYLMEIGSDEAVQDLLSGDEIDEACAWTDSPSDASMVMIDISVSRLER